MDVLYIVSQVAGWLATAFRAGGMLAKDSMTVKWLVSIGNLGWAISGILTGNIPLIVSNVLCLLVMGIEIIRNRKTVREIKKRTGRTVNGNFIKGGDGSAD